MNQEHVKNEVCYTDEMRELFDAVIEQTGIDWWTCKKFGRNHPDTHVSCWWCDPEIYHKSRNQEVTDEKL